MDTTSKKKTSENEKKLEAIELLGKSIEGTVYPNDGTSHYKVNPHIFHQALALLKQPVVDISAILQEADKALLAGKPVTAHSCIQLAITELTATS